MALSLDDGHLPLKDNVQEQLRQQLFYHLLNYTLPSLPAGSNPTTHTTLHYPRKPIDHPSKEPPPSPPWMPVPGGTLGGQPQRLRVSGRDDKSWVGVNAFGKGGVQTAKPLMNATNAHVVAEHSPISYFQKILTPDIAKLLNSTSELTLFLPVNDAWDALDRYERLYLESEFAADDLSRILNMHAVIEKGVRWTDSFESGSKLTTIDGTKLEVAVGPDNTTISSATIIHPDIYASNGVLHLVDKLLVPPGALKLTPEKYLLALNCTSFVSLIHSVGLTHLINGTDSKFTILAPRDDVFSLFGSGDLPERGSEELKRLLQYHFIPGRWTRKKLENGMLLETVLQEAGLDGGRQVMSVEVSADEKKKPSDRSVRFGGAGTIGDVEVDSALIYFVSRPLTPPSDSLQTALPFLELSSFLAAVSSTAQSDTLRTTPRTSLLIPHNPAFKRLGLLVSAHLLAPSSKQDLGNVLLHHALDTVEYARTLQNGSQHTFATLEGSDLQLNRLANGTIYASASGGWAGMKAEVYPHDLLTQTGVIHELSDILIPRSVQLTVGKLVKAAKGSTMANMVTKAGFEWILDGTKPPEGSPMAELYSKGVGWTLLCPTDDAFKEYNLTELYANTDALQAIVAQHLILSPDPHDQGVAPDDDPLNNNRPVFMEDSITYSTLHSPSSPYGDIIFRRRDDDKEHEYAVGIKGARGTDGEADWARVLSWGRSTTGGGTGGVIQIDRLLKPYHPPWSREYGAPTIVGVVGFVLICLFFYGSSDTPKTENAQDSAIESAKSFIAGGFGGMSAVLVGHPFDLTKTRLQTAGPGTYTGAIDVVKKTLARDGVTGLYRGMVPPLLGITPIFAISFWAYDASKKLIFAATPNRTSQALTIPELAAAGFLSAVPTTLVTAPVERAKVLLQVQGQGGSERKYKGVIDVMKHLYKEGGMRSIFRGTGATLARDGPGSAAYFAAYEVTKKALTPAGSSPAELNLGAIIIAGGTAGVAMWTLAIPPDVLKSRLQSAPTGTYSGFMDCARKTIAQDGVKALWRGFGPAMARAFPANAATFVSYFDLPGDMKPDVDRVFDVSGRLPSSSKEYKVLAQLAPPAFLDFIAQANRGCPSLFRANVKSIDIHELYMNLSVVFSAWRRLQQMRKSRENYSEADFVANVYSFRNFAIQKSTQRLHCTISLPQPILRRKIETAAMRILGTKTAVPDATIFVPASSVRCLSHSAKSPFKVLKNHPNILKSGCSSKGSSFRYQSTPRTNLPDAPGFEFASCFWEDKKPVHQLLEDAYRQNRMSTASAVRHLHSLHISAPIFGLVWASGTVRAHVDWCQSEQGNLPTVLSAPYSTEAPSLNPVDNDFFHEWHLDDPADIIKVYLFIRNLDEWTTEGFRERIIKGVEKFTENILTDTGAFQPWKRVGELPLATLIVHNENDNLSLSTQSTSPPKHKAKRRLGR
ncbi:hypothetical protein BD779DRAFT_1666663 [Infundibulicybe gibba]|nr:hypothetical protein BD779DRAFT_1666663 [Infundibulicybe gibba]